MTSRAPVHVTIRKVLSHTVLDAVWKAPVIIRRFAISDDHRLWDPRLATEYTHEIALQSSIIAAQFIMNVRIP
jgi:hypothetical protein